MAEETVNSNFMHGLQLQAKFELYLLGLTFTILGLSVQTAEFNEPGLHNLFELLGWLFLFISGIAGLLRQQWAPLIYQGGGRLQYLMVEKHTVEKAITVGAEVSDVYQVPGNRSLKEIFDSTSSEIDKLRAKLESRKRIALRHYKVHLWALLTGIALLICSRGYMPFIGLIHEIGY